MPRVGDLGGLRPLDGKYTYLLTYLPPDRPLLYQSQCLHRQQPLAQNIFSPFLTSSTIRFSKKITTRPTTWHLNTHSRAVCASSLPSSSQRTECRSMASGDPMNSSRAHISGTVCMEITEQGKRWGSERAACSRTLMFSRCSTYDFSIWANTVVPDWTRISSAFGFTAQRTAWIHS